MEREFAGIPHVPGGLRALDAVRPSSRPGTIDLGRHKECTIFVYCLERECLLDIIFPGLPSIAT
jgi:hypothetical protein